MFLFYREKHGTPEITQTCGHKYMADAPGTIEGGGAEAEKHMFSEANSPSLGSTIYCQHKKYEKVIHSFNKHCQVPAICQALFSALRTETEQDPCLLGLLLCQLAGWWGEGRETAETAGHTVGEQVRVRRRAA